MIEIGASTLAWISVVVVQAIIHYFVLGARRERIREENEAMLIEESLSYSGESIESDANAPNTPTGDPCFSTISYVSPDRQQGNLKAKLTGIPSEPYIRQVSIDSSEKYEVTERQFDLTQTGTEILKNCSLENIVEQQIRAIPQ